MSYYGRFENLKFPKRGQDVVSKAADMLVKLNAGVAKLQARINAACLGCL